MKLALAVGVVFFVLIGLAGCTVPEPAPDSVVFQWMHAFAAQDGTTLARLTCEASRSDNQNTQVLQVGLGIPVGYPGGGGGTFLGGGGGGGQAAYDVSDLQYATTFADERTARVLVTGLLRMASGLTTQSLRLNGTVPLAREESQWRVCGASG